MLLHWSVNEENDYLSLEEAARYLRASTDDLLAILEEHGLTSFLSDSIGRDFTIRRGDLAGLHGHIRESAKSRGVA